MRSFLWREFKFTSSLQFSPFIKLLLDSVECNETFDRLELGLHEALVNAALHGNAGDITKPIRVRMITTPNWLIWQVQDQGNGIPTESRISTLPNDLEAESGRGLFLIHKCFDDIRWSKEGNRLQLASRRN